MGLEGVEMLCATEKRFGIEISDEEAGTIRTVGQLHRLVTTKLGRCETNECLTHRAFYRLRRVLIQVLEFPRSGVRPGRSLTSALLPSQRHRLWAALAGEGLRMPALRPPMPLQFIAAALFVVGSCSAIVSFGTQESPLQGLLIGGITLAVMLLLWGLSMVLAAVPDESCLTIGDTARTLLHHNYSVFARGARASDQQEIWDGIRDIVADTCFISGQEVHKEARFIEDLGLD